MKRLAILLSLASAALIGCGGGGGSSDEATIKSNVKDFYYALGAGNGKEACGLIAAKKLGPPLPSCVKIVDGSVLTMSEALAGTLKGLKADRVVIKGDKATAFLSDGWSEARLVKEEGDWLIAYDPTYSMP